MVAERRQELVEQVAVGGVDLDHAEAGVDRSVPPLRRTLPAAAGCRRRRAPWASDNRRRRPRRWARAEPSRRHSRAPCRGRTRGGACWPCGRRAPAGCRRSTPCWSMKWVMRASGSKWRSLQTPRSCGDMRPSGVTAAASVKTRPAPPMARLARCTKCQSLAMPSREEYWHIGETPMRLRKVISRRRNSSNRCDMAEILRSILHR